jgi:hypothetical protein
MDVNVSAIAQIAVDVCALLAILWRTSSVLTTIRMDIKVLRRDVERIEEDKREDHRAIEQHIANTDARLIRHEDWHRDQPNPPRR